MMIENIEPVIRNRLNNDLKYHLIKEATAKFRSRKYDKLQI
jgi:hypothetical protein